jgi:hypothetical protein
VGAEPQVLTENGLSIKNELDAAGLQVGTLPIIYKENKR